MASSSRVRESSSQIYAEIDAKIRRDASVRRQARDVANEVKAVFRSHTPVRTGRLAASIHIESRPDRRGLPAFWVGTRVSYAGYVEFGTVDTPMAAMAAKTAFRYGGTAP
jgi:hypothetical protein